MHTRSVALGLVDGIIHTSAAHGVLRGYSEGTQGVLLGYPHYEVTGGCCAHQCARVCSDTGLLTRYSHGTPGYSHGTTTVLTGYSRVLADCASDGRAFNDVCRGLVTQCRAVCGAHTHTHTHTRTHTHTHTHTCMYMYMYTFQMTRGSALRRALDWALHSP